MSVDSVPVEPTPAKLRALIAEHWPHPIYTLAANIRLHPNRLSAILHGRMPMPPGLAERILMALSIAEEARRG
jgi:plasmid maintenance system antidote protein VapI